MKTKAGFTLLELVIVMTLMVLVLGLSGAQFTNLLPSAKLSSTGRELSGLIRMARIQAMSRGEERRVVIDLDGRRYGIPGEPMRSLPEDVGIRVVDPVSGERTGGTYLISAHALGSVQPCELVLWNRKRVLRIEIDPVVGSTVLKGGKEGG
ncbi:MAG: prepilin-type N-terminal cleavage/methylation domain-containing protein [Syntrophorhabdaceae bacterium]|nr:prepilin-type N-terminal cleavage/methylation domain-containing protein [Syntrophorhabdaceae bacterium]